VLIDAARPPWPGAAVDAVFAANLVHIAPWYATLGLIAGAAARLVAGGLLLIYGPFNEGGTFMGLGNAAFDADLRRQNPDWGLRDREAVDAAASAQGFIAEPSRAMPADNREVANDAGSSPDLAHDPLERVVGSELDPVAVREGVVGQPRPSPRRRRAADAPHSHRRWSPLAGSDSLQRSAPSERASSREPR
jgi:hypothetical protein